MKRTWIVLICSIIVLIIAFIFFIFPGYYFTYESKKAESTTSGGPPPTSSSGAPSFSTSGPPPSGSQTPSPSGSSSPTASGSSSAGPSASTSGSNGVSPSQSGGGTSGGGIFNVLYGREMREGEVKTLSASIANPVIGVTAAAVLVAFVLNPLLSLLFNFPFRDIFYFLFSSFLEFLGIRKRRRPWGVIYESMSKKSIAGAVVKIIEAPSGRVKEMRITDNEGRFGFLVEKGVYSLKVAKNGFSFPSQKITPDSKGSDGYYPQVYLGGNIKVKEGFLGLNIPLDMQANEPSKSHLLFLRFIRFFERIRLPILIIGTILSLVNFYLFRSVVDVVIILVYLFLWAFEIWNLRKVKPYGEVKDKMKKPLDLAILRFFRVKNSKLVMTCITDSHGRFYVLLPEGKFYFTAMKSGYLPYKSQEINVSRIKGSPEIKVIMKKAE
ncbi:MAG: carboxypeptidase-like regulatory domain-containing protein [Candidatus Berkelbacteria bacterium]|nr:carboxypeptidase-like regulatory domain-containing protein [Candidatus Berkelbacteria bacterium]